MKQTRTEQIGTRTGRISKTAVAGKDANFDYCFKQKQEVEEGTIHQEGWDVVAGEQKPEKWFNPHETSNRARTAGRNQLTLGDTVLCKRSKEASKYFNQFHTDKRRAQERLIKEAAPSLRRQLQEGGGDASIQDQSKFTQRVGPNKEAHNG